MSEKLQKVLARAGQGSRREMEALITAGRVSVDGKVATLGDRVEVNAVIRVDGHQVKTRAAEEVICRVLAYHKPE
ncbi:S4 domain-containing protein, partial [Aeromonas taiwanensis]